MTQQNAIKLFEQKQVRSVWDDTTEEWYFSVVDVVAILTDSQDPRNYWKVLKNRLKKEGNQSVTNCNQLKLPSSDGKFYKTDVATAEQLFRIIQSIPSPKAEPFKLWIAQVAAERLNQMQDPERSIEQAMLDYRRLGYSENHFTFHQKNSECYLDSSSSKGNSVFPAIPNVFAFSGEMTECPNSFSNCSRAVFATLPPRFAT